MIEKIADELIGQMTGVTYDSNQNTSLLLYVFLNFY